MSFAFSSLTEILEPNLGTPVVSLWLSVGCLLASLLAKINPFGTKWGLNLKERREGGKEAGCSLD